MTKRVLITGGGQRLGAQLCETFAQAGWEVWCHYHRSAEAVEELCIRVRAAGGSIYPIQANLHDEAQRRRLMADIVAQSGPLHALVNNASSFEPDAAESMDIDGAKSQLEVNLVAPLALSSLMVQHQSTLPSSDVESGALCVLHILDQKVFNLNPDYFSYTVSKLALERAVALQAQALAPEVRVCGVAPGLMYVSGPQSLDNFQRASRVNLMRRPTDPARVAESCLFLAQNPCITGVTLTVDNGQHLVPLPRDVMFVVEELLKDPDGC